MHVNQFFYIVEVNKLFNCGKFSILFPAMILVVISFCNYIIIKRMNGR